MYEAYFGFKEKPFDIAPDPRFFYHSRKHQEALALLVYGLREKTGFAVLSGELGIGKTTTVRAFLDELERNCQVAYFPNPKLSTTGFLKHVCHYFGLQTKSDSRLDHLKKLQDFLLESHQNGRTTALIFDEAHNLDIALFEEIRLLNNLETSSQKLLQVFLVGQPGLDDLLDRSDLRQLKQRISIRHYLRPLDCEETRDYIRTRIRVAGAENLNCFAEEAIQKIYKYSRGIPGIINHICHKSLLRGYKTKTPIIEEKTVTACIADLGMDRARGRGRFIGERRGVILAGRYLPYPSLILIVIFLALAAGGVGYFLTAGPYSSGDRAPLESSPLKQTVRLAPDLVATEKGKEAVPVKGDLIEESAISGAPSRMDSQADRTTPVSELEELSSPQGFKVPKTTAVTVEAGDTIDSIILKEFGRMDQQLLDAVRELNPGIDDLGQIQVGQVIRLPESGKVADNGLPTDVEEKHTNQAPRRGVEETPIVPEKEGEFETVTEQTFEAKKRETPTIPDESLRTVTRETGDIGGETPVSISGSMEPEKGKIESQAQTEQAALKKEAERPPLTLLATEEEVKEFFADYLDRYIRMDSNGFISLFSSRAVQNGKDRLHEIKKTYSGFFEQSRRLQYQLADMKIEIYQNSIVARARYQLDQIPKRGRKKRVFKGTIQWALIRENDELVILSLDYQPQGSR